MNETIEKRIETVRIATTVKKRRLPQIAIDEEAENTEEDAVFDLEGAEQVANIALRDSRAAAIY